MSGAQRSTPADAAPSAGRRDAAHAARIRRSAWVLAACAVAFYLAFVAWNLWRSVPSG